VRGIRFQYRCAVALLLALAAFPLGAAAGSPVSAPDEIAEVRLTEQTGGTQTFTLPEALERAKAANRDVDIARQRLAELEGLKVEARAEGLPQITGTAGYTRTWRKPSIVINGQPIAFGTDHNTAASASVDQLLWDGGRVFKAMRAARSEEKRGQELVRATEQQVAFQVKQTFYEILYTDKTIGVLTRRLAALRGHLSSMKQRYAKGLESDYAVMRQDVEVSNVEPDLIDAERRRELLVNGLKVLIALPQEDKLVPQGKLAYEARPLSDLEELVAKAKGNQPGLQAEKLRVDSLVQNVGLQKAAFWPKLSFNTTVQWQWQTNDISNFYGQQDSLSSAFNLSWPIFEGLRTHARVQQARAQLMQQRAATSQLEEAVVKDVRDAALSLRKAREALASQQKALALSRRATAIAGERFDAGLMSQLELNDTIDAQAMAEQQYLRATFDCLVSEAALERAVGGDL
jgi:outer membrane protein